MSSSNQRVRASRRETDPLALKMFALLKSETAEDKMLLLTALEARREPVSTERMTVCESAIRRFELETSQSLSKRHYERWRVAANDPSIPSATFVATTFGGSWSNAMSALGRKPAPRHAACRLTALGKPPTDEEMLAALAQSAQETGVRPFRFRDYREWAIAKQRTLPENELLVIGPNGFIQRFGSFAHACFLAGIPLDGRRGARDSRAISSGEKMVEVLSRAASECSAGKPITMGAYNLWRQRSHEDAERRGEWLALPCVPSIRNRFGSWPAALEAAGLLSETKAKNYARGRGKQMSAEQIADGLLRASRRLGPSFSVAQYRLWRSDLGDEPNEARAASVSVIRRHLRYWTEVERLLAIAEQDENPLDRLTEEIASRWSDAKPNR